jgi:hypothetical protein
MSIAIHIVCDRCGHDIYLPSEKFETVDAAWESAERKGWSSFPKDGFEDGGSACPKCSEAKQS